MRAMGDVCVHADRLDRPNMAQNLAGQPDGNGHPSLLPWVGEKHMIRWSELRSGEPNHFSHSRMLGVRREVKEKRVRVVRA